MSFSLTPKLRNCFSSASFHSRHFFSSLALLYAILNEIFGFDEEDKQEEDVFSDDSDDDSDDDLW